jgi:flavin-dependent dehydrogenase
LRSEWKKAGSCGRNTDVVILGAGPSGTATAIECARSGLRVVLIERTAFPRPVPGETLHPGVLPLLKELGVEDQVLEAGFLRHAGHFVGRHEHEQEFVAFGDDVKGPWLGLQAWRPEFDRVLLERARELGVTIHQPEIVQRVLVKHGRIAGVETATESLTALFVIDATGRWRWMAGKLGLKMEVHGPRRIAWYGYVEGECSARAVAPALRTDAEGWTWIARVRQDVYQWTRLNFDCRRPREGWLPEELVGLRMCAPMSGADVTWRMAQEPAGRGYFLVGDAACVLDPASSHGVLKAIMSGMMAGYLITRMHRGEVSEATAVQHYSGWLRDLYQQDIQRLTDLYSRLCLPEPY